MAPTRNPVVKNACADRRYLLAELTPAAEVLRRAKLALVASAAPTIVKTPWRAVATHKIAISPFVSSPTSSI